MQFNFMIIFRNINQHQIILFFLSCLIWWQFWSVNDAHHVIWWLCRVLGFRWYWQWLFWNYDKTKCKCVKFYNFWLLYSWQTNPRRISHSSQQEFKISNELKNCLYKYNFLFLETIFLLFLLWNFELKATVHILAKKS